MVTFRQETGELCLKNYMNHLDLKDYINLIFEVTCDGKILKKEEDVYKRQIGGICGNYAGIAVAYLVRVILGI